MFRRVCVLLLLTGALEGCAWDYLNNSDLVTAHGGDAVQSNLEQHTIYPVGYHSGKGSSLGNYGSVIPTIGSGGYTSNCLHNSDTASDGSNCGDRSADARPGGAGAK